MNYKEIKPYQELAPFIHSFWELKGDIHDKQWQRNFPDGCGGLVVNLGESCLTDNGSVVMEHRKTYVVGAMTTFKDSFITGHTHLMGVCLKPGAFANFYNYAPQHELINSTIELEKRNSPDIDKISSDYLNRFFIDRIRNKKNTLKAVIDDIHSAKGQCLIYDLAKRHNTTIRQLERRFKTLIGISPKEYSNIIRFQQAMNLIKDPDRNRSLLDVAFECGYYDHSHLTNEIKRNSGLLPSQL